MNSIYLSQEQPRWMPRTEQDIQDAIDRCLLDETHYLDLKREVGAGRAENKELARDLAQFAVDGGALLIGVEEVKGGPPVLSPVPLDGLAERVEQVARSSVDPPLFVTSTPIVSAATSGQGYLVVQVPVSATAPHMVDGAYYGRGHKVRSRLSDAEVRRLHDGQRSGEHVLRRELATYIERDPVPGDQRAQAHLFMVAVPAVPRPEMLLGLTGAEDAHSQLLRLMSRGGDLPNRLGDSFAPRLLSAGSLQRRSDGMAMTYGLKPGRELENYGDGALREDAVEFEFTEDGTLRLMTTRLSDNIGDQQVLFPTVMPILVRQFIGVAGVVASEVGYGGVWRFAVGATGVAGLPVQDRGGWNGSLRVSRDLERYERFTSATTSELVAQPGPVADRLVGRFLRGIGVDTLQDVRAVLD